MNTNSLEMLHDSADRLALEVARRSPAGREADYYIKAYKKVIGFLFLEHNKHKTTIPTPPRIGS